MTPGTRYPAIDALRGVSILLVVLHHVGLRLPLVATALGKLVPRELLLTLNWNGYNAVFIFFVASGFLIGRHALERWGDLSRIDVRSFYARRFSRIVPCLLLLLTVLSALHFSRVEDYVIGPRQSWPRAIASA